MFKKLFFLLIWQFGQFLTPFPKWGSWSYNLQSYLTDRRDAKYIEVEKKGDKE